MPTLLNLKELSQGIVGLVDVIARLAKNIEEAIRSGLRSGDTIRQAREQRRLRNLFKITAHLYRQQLAFSSSLLYFSENALDERGTWEEVKFEILAISRLLDQLEKYVLPYNDDLMVKHRKRYLELLTSIHERRGLLKSIYELEYEEAVRNRPKIAAMGQAYVKLRTSLQEIVMGLASMDDQGESLVESVGGVDSSKPLEPLDSRSPQKHAATAGNQSVIKGQRTPGRRTPTRTAKSPGKRAHASR